MTRLQMSKQETSAATAVFEDSKHGALHETNPAWRAEAVASAIRTAIVVEYETGKAPTILKYARMNQVAKYIERRGESAGAETAVDAARALLRADAVRYAFANIDAFLNDKSAYGYTPKGGTGYGLRTLLAFLEGRA